MPLRLFRWLLSFGCVRRHLVNLLTALLRATQRLTVVLESAVEDAAQLNDWSDTEATAASLFNELLDGGTLDALEVAPPPPAAVAPEPASSQQTRRRRSERPRFRSRESGYGAHQLPFFMHHSLDEIKAFVATARFTTLEDWCLLHLAAAAGRVDVMQHLCHELSFQATLKNRKGCSILHTAIYHARNSFVDWLVNDGEWVNDDGSKDQLDFDERYAVCRAKNPNHRPLLQWHTLTAVPCMGAVQPVMQATAKLDLLMLHSLLRSPDDDRGRGELPYMLCDRNEVESAIASLIFRMRAKQIRSREMKSKVTKCADFLMRRLREHDLCSRGPVFTRTASDDSLGDVNAVKEKLKSLLWWSAFSRKLAWPKTEHEKFSLYRMLTAAIEQGHVDMTTYLLVEWSVEPRPPSRHRYHSESLGDLALGDHVLHEAEARATGSEADGARSRKDPWLRVNLVNNWDGLSAAKLAEAIDERYARAVSNENRYERHEDITALLHFGQRVRGRRRKSQWPGLSGEQEKSNPYIDETKHVEMLRFLTGRYGVQGAPRLRVVLLADGLEWALRWLVDDALVDLDASIGGVRREETEVGDVCSICHDGFLNATTLRCGHEVCRLCARKYFTRLEELDRSAGRAPRAEFPCPVCRTLVPQPNSQPTDLVGVFAEELEDIAPWLLPPSDGQAGSTPGWPESAVPVGSIVAALAAHLGALALLELVAEKSSANLHLVYGGRKTLLHFAASACRPEAVKWLLVHGASGMAAQRSDDGLSPLQCAARRGDALSVRLLLDWPGAEGVHGSDVEGQGGWVDELLQSEHKHVRRIASDFLQDVATKRALTSLPRLIREDASMEAIRPLEDSLKSVFHDALDPDPPDLWAEAIQLATEHGRVDVVRWMYARLGVQLRERCIPRWEMDKKYLNYTSPTYEAYGRDIAAKLGRPEISAIYDEIKRAAELKRTSRIHQERLQELVQQGAPVAELEAMSELALTSLAEVHDEFLDAYDWSIGLRFMLTLRKSEWMHQSFFRVEGCGHFTLTNYVALAGHVHLVQWILERPSVEPDDVLRMLEMSIKHASVSDRAMEVQQLLCNWLAGHGHADLSSLTVLLHGDSDDLQRERENLSPGFWLERGSLFDAAAGVMLGEMRFGDEEDRPARLRRCWASMEFLATLQPAQPFDVGVIFLSFSTLQHYSEVIDAEVSCEQNVLRLLQLASCRADFHSVPRGKEHTVAYMLAQVGFLDCLTWLVQTHGVDVQGLRITRWSRLAASSEPDTPAYVRARHRRLAALQEQQARRAAAGPA